MSNTETIDTPLATCRNCGPRRADEFEQRGEYFEDGFGPFPCFTCVECGGEVVWE
jgi:hypothetical protein